MHQPDYPIATLLQRIEALASAWPKAAMFDLYERGFRSVYEQLVACIVSVRTRDEVTIPIALRLFATVPDPERLLRLGRSQLLSLLEGTTFPGQKAETIHRIAESAVADDWRHRPPRNASLMAIKGVGVKCANLALGVALQVPAISVDVHVHRVVNRWGLVGTPTPEATLAALEQLVPKDHWIDLNRLLMPFGKHLCTHRAPKCSVCPVAQWCDRVGVTQSR